MSSTTRNSRVSQRRDMGWLLHPRWHDHNHNDHDDIDIEHDIKHDIKHDIQHDFDQLQYDDDLDQHHHHDINDDHDNNGCAMHWWMHMALERRWLNMAEIRPRQLLDGLLMPSADYAGNRRW